jgi:alanyl-tRNA synthetase
MTGNEIRSEFLKFFEDRGHRVVRSSSLIPAGDPTLLFSNAGMNQFKDVFLGKERREYTRAASSQKCVRAGGKHNDLENVGRTARHHTFFEMLGNFSFGDYFKDDAIAFAWEFLTKTCGLPPERMVATVFKGENGVPRDGEAHGFWLRHLPGDRIFELGMHDNFWAMGDTGPCGPCSEVHFHQGDHLPCGEEAAGRPCQGVACDCDRWLEIWNLVFMQYDRDDAGVLNPLPAPCVDTGMGLERLAAVMQGKLSNFETDLLKPLIDEAASVCGIPYGGAESSDVSLRVVSDHVRAATFLVADGVIPSNEGRGYVLRKIVRRAARHGKMLGIERPFLKDLVGKVCEMLGEAYPEIVENRRTIETVLLIEEESFINTLNVGLKKLLDVVASLTPPNDREIPGDALFKLYDTFGFPLDLAEDIAREQGLVLDLPGFQRAMERQRELARQSWKGEMDTQVGRELAGHGIACRFVGYSTLSVADARCSLILKEGKPADSATAGETVQVAFDRTPFYAESGGQVGDTGHIYAEDGVLKVLDTQRPVPGLILCQARVQTGRLRVGNTARLEVDEESRAATMAHHTATHLLHAALRETLGTHVKQAGSLVAPTHLRFDFHHFAAVDKAVLAGIESRINLEILKNQRVSTQVMPLDEAVATGAMALFGEKYEDEVRVVSVPGFSKELCGGTHVESTGRIGLFKITSEHSVSAGVRRIEAVTHMPAYRFLKDQEDLLLAASSHLNVPPEKVPASVDGLLQENRRLEKDLSRLRLQMASGAASEEETKDVGGLRLLVRRVDGLSPSEVKNLADALRDKIQSGVVVIGNRMEDKASLTVALTKDAVERLKAVDLARPLGKIIGGGGGGKPDLAEAGGKLVEKLDEALKAAREKLEEVLKPGG